MKIIKPYYEILSKIDGKELLKSIERAGRTCYKSEDKITHESAEKFISMLVQKGHESVLEHEKLSVLFVCDRGVSHEIVRHRIASFSQESTRYVGYTDNYKDDVTDDDVIEYYESGLSMKKISILSNGKYTEWEVYKVLDSNKIERRNLGNTGVIYDNFFDVIDNKEKAYLLGMIQADGNLRKDSNQISISQTNGWYLERMIRDFIKPNIKGSLDRKGMQYSFCNDKLYNSLISKGIIPNKSYDMENIHADLLWNSIPENLKVHFLRGLLDGDGSLRFFKQNNESETDSCNISWNGNFYLLTLISNWFEKEFNYKMSVNKVSGSEKLYRISITNPKIGDSFCQIAYDNFLFPYGHPIKTSRVYDRIKFNYNTANWGSKKFNLIIPNWIDGLNQEYWIWMEAMDKSEENYSNLIKLGWQPQQARSVLPNSLKTEIVVTANLREWRTIFKQRTSLAAHPQMRELMCPLLNELKTIIPIVFNDINY